MAYPFGKFPTLSEFIQAAVAQGCVEKLASGVLRGPRGDTQPRYLTRDDSKTPAYILSDIENNERLTPTTLGSLVRALNVQGYDHLLLDPEDD